MSSPIKRGSRFYIELKAIGEVDDNGKSVLSIGYKGKLVAEKDKLFGSLLIGLIEECLRMAMFSTEEALIADFDSFLKYVETLKRRLPTKSEAEAASVEGEANA